MKISQLYLTIILGLFVTALSTSYVVAKTNSIPSPSKTSVVGPPFIFSAPDLVAEPGEDICVDFTTSGFVDVLSFQYGLEYDPNILQFNFGTSTAFDPLDFFAGLPVTGEPIVTIGYGSLLGIPFSINDGAQIFSLCFTVIGDLGECSPLHFTLQAGGQAGAMISVETQTNTYGINDIIFNDGEICIEENNVEDIMVDISPIDADCNGAPTGSITLGISGGIPPFSVLVTNCMTGTPVFGPATTSSSSIISNLLAADYCIQITDSNAPMAGTFSEQVTINQGSIPIVMGYDSISVSCPGQSDGMLEVLLEPSTIPIGSYNWSDGTTNYTGNPISGIPGGDYSVTITDVNGCSNVDMVSLFAPPIFEIDLVASMVTNPICPGEATGEILVHVNGGTPNYTYTLVNNGTVLPPAPSGAIFASLVAGDWEVSVVDANGCGPITATFTLEDPPAIEVMFSNIQDVSCGGQPPFDGSATATASNGPVNVYTYEWESGEQSFDVNSSTALQLEEGWATITVTSEGCAIIDSVEIGAPAPIQIIEDQTIISNINCFGGSDGSISIAVEGGVPGYSYSWSNGETTAQINDLSAGLYTVLIRDANDCTLPLTIEISEPDLLEASIVMENIQEITCNGSDDGVLVVSYTGGVGNVSYDWSNGNTFSTNTGLSGDDYGVTITDGNGCTAETSQLLEEPDSVTAVVPQPSMPDCFGEQTFIGVTSADGGVGQPYTFSVNAGGSINVGGTIPVFAGEYTVTIFDANGCSTQEEVNIGEPNPVVVNAGPDLEVNLGDPIQLFVQVQSSLIVDSISWTPGVPILSCDNCTNPTANTFNSTTFEVVAYDENGCRGSDEVFVDVDKDRNVYFPNVFSPNGDGINDLFSPFTGAGVEVVNSFNIFDRWGEIVYNQEDFLPGASEFPYGWDGKYRGKRAPVGVYLYLAEVTFIDGVTLLYRGDVTIVQY